MLKHKKTLIVTTLILLLPMLVGLLLWKRLPEQLPIHWDAAGDIDGWASRPIVVFGLPGIMLAVHWLGVLVTNADPKKRNQADKLQLLVLWICPVLSVLLMGITYGTAMGMAFRVEAILPAVIGIVFVIIGNYMPKCKQNYTIGIKLPWTLDSEENWNKTHRLAGFIWVICGILMVIAALFSVAIWLLLPVALVMVAVPILYSYWLHRRSGQ